MSNRDGLLPMYQHERPSHTMAMASLLRFMDVDDAEQLWRTACTEAEIPVTHNHGNLEDLLRAVDALERHGVAAAACARGLRIRIRTWRTLSAAIATTTDATAI